MKRGKLEADLTVTKLAEDKFLVVVTDTMHRHAENLAQAPHPPGRPLLCHGHDLGLCPDQCQGPKSRGLMQALTDTDMSNQSFPYRHAQEIAIGYARCYCQRLTYLGELAMSCSYPLSTRCMYMI